MLLRRVMKRVLFWIVNHIYNHLTGSAKLHWPKVEGTFGTERLMEYSPA